MLCLQSDIVDNHSQLLSIKMIPLEDSPESFNSNSIKIVGSLIICWEIFVIFSYHRRHREHLEQFPMFQISLLVDMMLMTCGIIAVKLSYIANTLNGFTCILGKTSISKI